MNAMPKTGVVPIPIGKLDIPAHTNVAELAAQLIDQSCMDEGSFAHRLLEAAPSTQEPAYLRLKEIPLLDLGAPGEELVNNEIWLALGVRGAVHCHPLAAALACLAPVGFAGERVRRFYMAPILAPGEAEPAVFEIQWIGRGHPRLRGVVVPPNKTPYHRNCSLVFST